MRRAKNTAWVLGWLVIALFAIPSSCQPEKKGPEVDSLAEARQLLAQKDFGESFGRGLDLLDLVLRESRESRRTGTLTAEGVRRFCEAQELRAEAQLQLLVAALVTESASLTEQLKKSLGWELSGNVNEIRNFQLLGQDVLESLRLVTRELPAEDSLAKRASNVAEFVEGLQAVHYRTKRTYFLGKTALEDVPDLRWLNDVLMVWSLLDNATRAGSPAKNWQNVALTVLSEVCPDAAARYLVAVCQGYVATEDQPHCPADLTSLPVDSRKLGAAILRNECILEGASADASAKGEKGMVLVRKAHMKAVNSVLENKDNIPEPLVDWMESVQDKVKSALDLIDQQMFQEPNPDFVYFQF